MAREKTTSPLYLFLNFWFILYVTDLSLESLIAGQMFQVHPSLQQHTWEFFLLVETECRLKSCKVHRVLLLNIKFLFVLLLLPTSVVPISDRELFGTGAASELCCSAPCRGGHSGAAPTAGWCCSWPLQTPCPILGKIKLGASQKETAQGF